MAARRKNLQRARSAPKDLIYRPTPRRMAAYLKNLRKAVVARSETASSHLKSNGFRFHSMAGKMLMVPLTQVLITCPDGA